jgi:hypothetical protein
LVVSSLGVDDVWLTALEKSRNYRSGFVTLPPVLLQKQAAVVLLLERALVFWSLAMDEHGWHEDLRGSSRRSVIPYIHGRMEL